MKMPTRLACLAGLAALLPTIASADLYSSATLAWTTTNNPGASIVNDQSNYTGGLLEAMGDHGGISGQVLSFADYGVLRARVDVAGALSGYDLFTAAVDPTYQDQIIISGGSGLGLFERTFTITGAVSASLVQFNTVRSRLLIDNGGGIFNLLGPGEYTYRAAFYFDQPTYISGALDLAISAVGNGAGGNLDLDFSNTVVLSDIRVVDDLGRPVDGNFTFTSLAGATYPVSEVPLPATLPLLLGAVAAVAPRLRRRTPARQV